MEIVSVQPGKVPVKLLINELPRHKGVHLGGVNDSRSESGEKRCIMDVKRGRVRMSLALALVAAARAGEASGRLAETLEAAGPADIPQQQIVATVRALRPLAPDTMLLHLQTPRTHRLRFLAGQAVTLETANGAEADYPVASCPCDDRNLQFHVRRLPGNRFADYVFKKLKSGDIVEVPAGVVGAKPDLGLPKTGFPIPP